MANLPSITTLKTYGDESSIVDARGKIKIGPLGIVYMDGEYEGKKIIIEDEKLEQRHGDEINIRAITVPNVECIVLLPYVNKNLL
jgi:hypothetical protein